jgi:hypothetical protein
MYPQYIHFVSTVTRRSVVYMFWGTPGVSMESMYSSRYVYRESEREREREREREFTGVSIPFEGHM